MNKFIVGIIVFLVLVIFMGFWFTKSQLNWPANALINFGKNMETTKICFNENCFMAQVAKTQTERTKGLMFRENLASNEAMLFVFETPGIYSFWMKNCKIPLDIIWLDEYYKVLAIRPNNKPCPVKGSRLDFIEGTSTELAEECPSINPNVSAKYVLEINAGLSSKIGLQEGSYLSISATTLPTIDK